jgi:alginate O-acetyltransferase complex protein AlgI
MGSGAAPDPNIYYRTNVFNVRLGIKEIALPIGISFFTFQILSYLIDLYRGTVALQKSFFRFTLYVSFFPQLIAGPIVRYKTVEEEILHRKENLLEASQGWRRFTVGLAKKVIIANNVAAVSEYIYQSSSVGTSALWLAAICYAFQIYFDFSGYSDMAIGLGKIFGFHFLENFDYPYMARSVTDFWRRWHISLSSWFRDYVYIPLGGNRVGKVRLVLNILIVWTLTGFWHGAQWNFVIWGIYYAVLLIIEKLFLKKGVDSLPKLFGWIYAMFFVIIGWVIFNTTDIASLGNVLKNMFVYVKTDWQTLISSGTSVVVSVPAVLVAAIFSFPIAKKIKLRDDKFLGALVLNLLSAALLAASIICIISSSYNPFIYFRF